MDILFIEISYNINIIPKFKATTSKTSHLYRLITNMLKFQKYPSINHSQQGNPSSVQQKQNSIISNSKQESSLYLNDCLKCHNSNDNGNQNQKSAYAGKDIKSRTQYNGKQNKNQPSASSIVTSDQYTKPNFSEDSQCGGPTLFEFELRSHNLRKQQEHFHNKTVHEYFKRKRQMVRVANEGDKKKRKIAEVQNKMRQCSRNTNNNWKTVSTYLEGAHLQSQQQFSESHNFSKSLRKSADNTIFKNSHLSDLFKSQPQFPFDANFLQKSSSPSLQNQFYSTSWLANNNINKRQVYLSNISNLGELRQSLSYSRSKFNRKIIKMDREIGKNYVQFEDRLLGERDYIKGIFL